MQEELARGHSVSLKNVTDLCRDQSLPIWLSYLPLRAPPGAHRSVDTGPTLRVPPCPTHQLRHAHLLLRPRPSASSRPRPIPLAPPDPHQDAALDPRPPIPQAPPGPPAPSSRPRPNDSTLPHPPVLQAPPRPSGPLTCTPRARRCAGWWAAGSGGRRACPRRGSWRCALARAARAAACGGRR